MIALDARGVAILVDDARDAALAEARAENARRWVEQLRVSAACRFCRGRPNAYGCTPCRVAHGRIGHAVSDQTWVRQLAAEERRERWAP